MVEVPVEGERAALRIDGGGGVEEELRIAAREALLEPRSVHLREDVHLHGRIREEVVRVERVVATGEAARDDGEREGGGDGAAHQSEPYRVRAYSFAPGFAADDWLGNTTPALASGAVLQSATDYLTVTGP